jgi:uncharacterized protein YbjT (DUF2867 family)
MNTILVTGATGNVGRQVVSRLLAEPVTSTVREITGTPARPFREWISDHAGDFR